MHSLPREEFPSYNCKTQFSYENSLNRYIQIPPCVLINLSSRIKFQLQTLSIRNNISLGYVNLVLKVELIWRFYMWVGHHILCLNLQLWQMDSLNRMFSFCFLQLGYMKNRTSYSVFRKLKLKSKLMPYLTMGKGSQYSPVNF